MTTILLVLLLTVVIGAAAGPNASASVPALPATPQISRGFDIYNLSGLPLTIASESSRRCVFTCSNAGNYEGPPKGTQLLPGQVHHFEVDYLFAQDHYVDVSYSAPSNSIFFEMSVDHGNIYNIQKIACGPTLRCETNREDTTLSILDPPGTVRTIGPGQGQEQAQTLKQFCAKNSLGKCDFKVTHEDRILAKDNLKVLNPVIPNRTLDDVQAKVSCTNSYELTDSVGGSITIEGETGELENLVAKVKVAITAEYHHGITATAEFHHELTYNIRPGFQGWVEAGAAIFRDYGDFTITAGNTTWHINDVYFDSPDTTGEVVWQPVTQELNGGPITPVRILSQSKTMVAEGSMNTPPIPDECQSA